jgi:hypothetical protein
MTTTNGYRVRLAIASALVAFGFAKLLAQVFLGNWQVRSAGQTDIAARGVWLLAMLLPYVAIAALALTLAVVVTLTRETGQSLGTRGLSAGVGGIVGVALIILGADPTASALKLLRWPSVIAYNIGSAVVAVLVLAIGVVVTVRLARAWRVVPAAA